MTPEEQHQLPANGFSAPLSKLDFSKVDDKRVGYHLRAHDMSGPYFLQTLTFKEFISPYSHISNSYQEVCQNLLTSLEELLKETEEVADEKGQVFIDVTAKSALRREAIRNSLSLIKENYEVTD